MKLYYQPEGHWFGDCMPFGKGDTFICFIREIPVYPARLENHSDGIWL